MYRKSQNEEVQRIALQAAEWLQVMKRNPSAQEREAFTAWITVSQQHLQEFLIASMLDRELAGIDPQRRFDVDAIVAQAQAGHNVVPLRTQTPAAAEKPVGKGEAPTSVPNRLARFTHWGRAAGFAALMLAGATAWWGARPDAAETKQYATMIGEQRVIELEDGSIVSLNARSRIAVSFSEGARELQLRAGEAMFKVAHDSGRPFRVHVGSATIQAVGTQFNVNRLESGTTVSVTEGKVRVSAERLPVLAEELTALLTSRASGQDIEVGQPRARIELVQQPTNLSAGEAVQIVPGGQAVARDVLHTARADSWRERRLTFHGDTLADIAEQFNRYNVRQIEVEGEAARAQRFSGVFDADDPDSFVQFLQRRAPLEIISDDDRVRVRLAGTAREID